MMDNELCTTKTPCNNPCEQKSIYFFYTVKIFSDTYDSIS